MTSFNLKVALRNLNSKKFYSLINAFGLSIGLASSIIIYLFINDEFSFDQFHVNKSSIYRLESKSISTALENTPNPYVESANLPTALCVVMRDEMPEVKYATRYNYNHVPVRAGDKTFREPVNTVDADFFKMFSFSLISGNVNKLFENPTDAVITASIAKKYFNDQDPVGKTLTVSWFGEKTFEIKGVIKDPPANSSFSFGILLPQENRGSYKMMMSNWGMLGTPTFIQLQPGVDVNQFKINLNKLAEKYMADKFDMWQKELINKLPKENKVFEINLTALSDIHLKSSIAWNKVSDLKYSFILGGLSLLILCMAFVNYISLALTSSASRRKEVGVRKISGATRKQLMYQFESESLLLAFIALILALIVVEIILPFVNSYTYKDLSLASNPLQLSLFSLLLTLVAGIIAGAYPAFYLSSSKPAAILRAQFSSKLKAGFNRPLVAFQFALSAILMISSIVMFRQMNFIGSKDLGYNKEKVMMVSLSSDGSNKRKIAQFKNLWANDPDIVSVSGATDRMDWSYHFSYNVKGIGNKSAHILSIDPEYIPTLNMKIVEGRNFDPAIATDSSCIIVNEALVRDMNWSDPLNEHLKWKGDSLSQGSKVIGVVKDYHFLSLENEITPVFLTMDKELGDHYIMLLKLSADAQIPFAVEKVKKAYHQVVANIPFEFSFLDDHVEKQYQSYNYWMNIIGAATLLAILISSLGLFGLAGLNTLSRTKEIGIRKVMGANVGSLMQLLNKQYVQLTLLGYLIAVPVAWYFMSKWLHNFKYSIDFEWSYVALSILLQVIIALAAVSYHTLKTARSNPVNALKTE